MLLLFNREKERRVYITLDTIFSQQVLLHMKLKPLSSSLREKKRYLAYQVITPNNQPLTHDVVEEAIRSTYGKVYGSYNVGSAGIMPLSEYYDPQNNVGIVRVHNNYVKQVQASLPFVTEINNTPVIIKSLLRSGVLNKIRTCLKVS